MALYALFYAIVSLLWLWLFASLSRSLKAGLLLTVFGAGLLAGPVAGLATHVLDQVLAGGRAGTLAGAGGGRSVWQSFALFFLLVGPIEELCKFLAALLPSLRRSEFASALDGVVLAITAALGFACGENILYLFAFGLEATLPRLILGNLGHAAYAVFWGYAMGVTLHENAEGGLLFAGLIAASLLHGLYNFLLEFSTPGALGALFLSGMLFWFGARFLLYEARRERTRPGRAARRPGASEGEGARPRAPERKQSNRRGR